MLDTAFKNISLKFGYWWCSFSSTSFSSINLSSSSLDWVRFRVSFSLII